jgi:hypothetical protein
LRLQPVTTHSENKKNPKVDFKCRADRNQLIVIKFDQIGLYKALILQP